MTKPWPGPGPDPDPDSITAGDLHPLIRGRLPASAIADRLATTADHVLLAAARNPARRRASLLDETTTAQ